MTACIADSRRGQSGGNRLAEYFAMEARGRRIGTEFRCELKRYGRGLLGRPGYSWGGLKISILV